MVGILLKIGKQSENVGEEEVFGRFCIRDVTENPSGGRISAGYPPDIRPPESGFCIQYSRKQTQVNVRNSQEPGLIACA